MRNIDIIETFESEEMASFISCCTLLDWSNILQNKEWLETESTDNKLRYKYYIWLDNMWQIEGSGDDKYKNTHSWPLEHIYEILEAIMSTQLVTSNRVLVVIPTIEAGHRFDDFKDVVYYKAKSFVIWSDFFDLEVPDRDIAEGNRIINEYMEQFHCYKFMKGHPELVNTFNVYFKNK